MFYLLDTLCNVFIFNDFEDDSGKQIQLNHQDDSKWLLLAMINFFIQQNV